MSNTKTPDGERTKHGGSADAELLELEKRLEEVRQTPTGETDKEIDEKADRLLGLERRIATVPAKGLTGIAVKLRLVNFLIGLASQRDFERLLQRAA